MTDPVKILGVDDEADFEALIQQRFRRQIRDGVFTFCFAHHGEEAQSVDAIAAAVQTLNRDEFDKFLARPHDYDGPA